VKVVVVKKSNIAMLVVRLVNPHLGMSRFKNKEMDGKAKYKWKVRRRHQDLTAAKPAKRTFDQIVVESGRRIYTMI